MKKHAVRIHSWFPAFLTPLLLVILLALPGCQSSAGEAEEEETEPEGVFAAQEIPLSTRSGRKSFNELGQSVVPLADGGFATFWEAETSPGNRDVFMQVLDREGKPRLAPEACGVARTDADETLAVGTPRTGGGFFVAFCREEEGCSTVRVKAYDQDLNSLWGEEARPVCTQGLFPARQYEPSLVADPWGGLYVALQWDWVEIRCQHLDAAGNPLWGEEALSVSGMDGDVGFPRTVLDDQGGLFVLWQKLMGLEFGVAHPVWIEGQHLNTSGQQLWGAEKKVIHRTRIEANGYGYSEFAACSDGKGGVIVAFNDDLDSSNPGLDVVAQRVDAGGALRWSRGAVVCATPVHQQLDAIVAAGDGGVFVAVHHVHSPVNQELRLHRLGENGGQPWGEAGIMLSHPEQRTLEWKVYGSFNGRYLHLVWTRQDPQKQSDFDVYMGRFRSDGSMIDPPGGICLFDNEAAMFTRGLAWQESSGTFLAVWEDSRRGLSWDDFDIYAGLVTDEAYGPKAPAAGRESVATDTPQGSGPQWVPTPQPNTPMSTRRPLLRPHEQETLRKP